ncbi:hypothetical protein Tco_0118592, partial [Tanacetum coccineum]
MTSSDIPELAFVGPSRKRCRFPPPASAVPPTDTTAMTVILEFVIPEATAPVAPVKCHRLIEACRQAFARDVRISDLKFRAADVEFRLEQCERGWIQDSARIRRLEEH